eukprot:jgi/Tetstr1/446706/TSEL_034195.t1
MGAPISHYPEWMTGALGRRREAHTTLLERIASFGTSGYGCHHGTMRLLVVCAVRRTGFLNRMMPPSELDRFLEAVDAANISAAFLLLGLDACDQSTPCIEAAIVQMSMPADFGGLNLALLQSEAPAAFYSAQSVVLPKLVREYGAALGAIYEAVRAEVSSAATSALPWARETRRVYETGAGVDVDVVVDAVVAAKAWQRCEAEERGGWAEDRSAPADASREAGPEMAAEANAPEVDAAVESPDETEEPRLEAPEVADRDESHEEVVKLKAIVASLQAAIAQLKEKMSTQYKKFKALQAQCGDLVLTINAEDSKWRKLYRSKQRQCLRSASLVDGAAA